MNDKKADTQDRVSKVKLEPSEGKARLTLRTLKSTYYKPHQAPLPTDTFPGASKPLGHRPVFKTANGPVGGWLKSFNLSKMNDAFRSATVNPAVRSALLGLGTGALTYAAAPMIGRLGQTFLRTPQQYDMYGRPVDITKRDRQLLSIAAGLGAAGISTDLSWDSERPYKGLLSYAPKKMDYTTDGITKKNSAYLTQDSLIPMSMAKEAIMADPRLTMAQRAQSLMVLDAIPANDNTPISSNDIVASAIKSGVSGVAGYAVGHLTATALGLSDPNAAGISTGLISAAKTFLF